jgi:hypothetical protein
VFFWRIILPGRPIARAGLDCLLNPQTVGVWNGVMCRGFQCSIAPTEMENAFVFPNAATRPGVFDRRMKTRFSRLKSPKPGVALCVLYFTTTSDCWTMFGSVTVPPSRRSCMTTPSDCWIRSGSRGTGIVRPSICARRAKSWDCFGHVAFLRRKFLPRRVGGCSDVLQNAQRPRRILAELWTIRQQEKL